MPSLILLKEIVWHCSNFRYLTFSHSVSPELPSNETISPNQREALTKTQQAKLANAVQYIWETGEDKYMFRYFHAGFWESCEKHTDGKSPLAREMHVIKWL